MVLIATMTPPEIIAKYRDMDEEKLMIIKRRSRVLRRRTRQAALDKPRVHDGQLGFCSTKALMSVRLKNRAFEEKQQAPLDLNKKYLAAWYVDKRHQIASCSRESVPNPD